MWENVFSFKWKLCLEGSIARVMFKSPSGSETAAKWQSHYPDDERDWGTRTKAHDTFLPLLSSKWWSERWGESEGEKWQRGSERRSTERRRRTNERGREMRWLEGRMRTGSAEERANQMEKTRDLQGRQCPSLELEHCIDVRRTDQ